MSGNTTTTPAIPSNGTDNNSKMGAGMNVEELLGPTLYRKKEKKRTSTKEGSEPETEYTIETCATKTALKDTKFLLLYFSASWCPPCQSFTPIVSAFYTKHGGTTSNDHIEIIYLSSDQNVEQFTTYFTKKMSFLYTLHPFSPKESAITKEKRQALPKLFRIEGIPTLVVLHLHENQVYYISNKGRPDMLNYQKKLTSNLIQQWNEKIPLYMTIEEGIQQAFIGDGSMWSILKSVFWTILQNPLYVVGMIYIYKYLFQKPGAPHQALMTGSTTTPNEYLEPVPEDEF